MTIDIRAHVTCSLGTLISASISDDYVQGTGLIKTKGSCELSGLFTPAVGTEVTFAYTKAGVTRSIPRKLRVLSSFADPFRRKTKVELGCLLTYLQDKTDIVKWKAQNDSLNSNITQEDEKIITVPIHASSLAAECLAQLGISGTVPLTNKFSIAEFDFSSGYVNILSSLLVSESLCGYLNESEQLVVFSLNEVGGTGPLIDSQSIIDLEGIGFGQLPGDAVTVSYKTLKLKKLDIAASDPAVVADQETTLWEKEETIGLPQKVYVQNPFYASNPFPYPVPEYFEYSFTPHTITETTYDELNRVISRVSTTYTILADVAPSFIQHISGLSGGDKAPTEGSRVMTTVETETFSYVVKHKITEAENKDTNAVNMSYEQIEDHFVEVSQPLLFLYASTQIYDYAGQDNYQFTINSTDADRFISSKTIIKPETKTQDGTTVVTKTVTERYKCSAYTQRGQQSLASALEGNRGAEGFYTALAPYFLAQATTLVYEGAETRIETGRSIGLQRRPEKSELNNAKNADGGDPNNGYRTSSTSDLALAVGSRLGQLRIDLSLPYAPDDTFIKIGSNPVRYQSLASDAPQKAAMYGRCQNRLLLGHRSGMNIQTLPELLPAAPFSPIIVQANGLSAMYRTNGTNWQMSADGVLVSTDALFYGAVGGTGTFWFPVAPGITTLPTTPAVVDGQMTVSSVVPVWNETVKAEARLRVGLGVQSLSYPLTLLTTPDPIIVKVGLGIRKISKVDVPAGSVAVAGVTPVVGIGAAIRPSFADIAVVGLAPAVAFGCAVQVPSVDMAVAGATPAVSATLTTVLVPVANIAVAGATPDLQAGDDYYSNLASQFFTLLRDWRVDWWGD